MISSIMSNDHRKLDSLMDSLEEAVRNKAPYLKIVDKFNELKWELTKHLSIEEKTVFLHCKNIPELSVITDRLVNDHAKIHLLLSGIEDNLQVADNLDELKDFINRHRNFEDSEFYPLLDDTLASSVKELIIKRISGFSSD